MADLKEKILEKYAIDISQENILKLYKIDNLDISEQEIQEKIQATRKRWQQSVNGANEKNAERDRARLEKADKYESIITNKKIRKELFNYYNSTSGSGNGRTENGGIAGVGFAREYFKLVSTTKKLRKKDVEFFFEYYQEERKNKKAILEMLNKEFKIIGLGKESNYSDEDENEPEEKKKKSSSPLIVNLFQETTIIKLRKCIGFYELSKSSREVCQRFPNITDSLYDFLNLKEIGNIQEFETMLSATSKNVYAIRQEKGAEYISLVDLFNTLYSMVEYQDVVDNFTEFKLMVRYPNLTPYMYAFVDMRPSTLKGLLKIANSEYVFRDETDFLLNYFIPMHDNFGISDSGISAIIKKAEKNAKSNKVLNDIEEKLGRKKKRKISIGAEILYWLVYYPIFVLYLVFEIFKLLFTNINKFVIPTFIILLLAENWLFPQTIKTDNLLVLGMIFSKNEWYTYLSTILNAPMGTSFEIVVMSILYIVLLLLLYVLPALFASSFLNCFSEDLNKRYDWIGYERTFRNIFDKIREKAENQYTQNEKIFMKDKGKKAVINIVCTILIAIFIGLIPKGVMVFVENMGGYSSDVLYDENNNLSQEQSKYIEITATSANIRAGASTDYQVVQVVSKGTVLEMTGNEIIADNGNIWYELYLNDEKTEIGWCSEKVAKVQE